MGAMVMLLPTTRNAPSALAHVLGVRCGCVETGLTRVLMCVCVCVCVFLQYYFSESDQEYCCSQCTAKVGPYVDGP